MGRRARKLGRTIPVTLKCEILLTVVVVPGGVRNDVTGIPEYFGPFDGLARIRAGNVERRAHFKLR
jgi:hypothetical protein